MRRALLLLAALLAGCATEPWDARWGHDRASPEHYALDRAECLDEATVGDRIGGYRYQTRDPILFKACMQRRGWRLLPDESAD